MQDQFIFFWGGPFSQWAHSPFVIDNQEFSTAEQWMMWNKAILFKDNEIAEKILKTDDPYVVKKYGRQVKNFDDTIWMQHAFDIVVQGNVEKFKQNPKFLKYIKSTVGKEIVEASPYDRRWGIGLSEKDPKIYDRNNWLGDNLLGKAIMKARDIIINDDTW